MSILIVNESIDFRSLKEMLEVSDGNLASHLVGLEKKQYVMVKKQFIGRSPILHIESLKTEISLLRNI